MPTIRQTAIITLMLAWILLQGISAVLLTIRDHLILLLPMVTHVRRDVRESGLIFLPSEILYHIVEALACLSDEMTQTSGSQGPVLTLSQVCCRLRGVCSQKLFNQPPPLTLSHLVRRFEGIRTASDIGRYVDRLSISLTTLDSENESILSSTLDYLVNLTTLTVFYLKGDVRHYRNLIGACCRRTSLKRLHVEETGLDMTITPTDPGETTLGSYFVDHLVQAILLVDGLRLGTFVHIASLPLHSSTFTALRTRAAHLQTIVFRTSIQSHLRALFNQPTTWASASTLKELVIRTCSGVHHGAIAVHVANGVFGQLQRLSVIRSGYDDQGLFGVTNTPPRWTIGVLERLNIDHASNQEVMALSTIQVKAVFATRVFTIALINALNSGGWLGLQAVHTHSQGNDSNSLFLELDQACNARGVILSTDAEPYGNCNCHNE